MSDNISHTTNTTLFTKNLGNLGESLAARYLEDLGFEIKQRNFRIRNGEIDIIAQKNNLLIFVEVKTRSNNYFNLSEIITLRKQRIIIATAHIYVIQNQIDHSQFVMRFDVALVENFKDNKAQLHYIENAFQVQQI